MKIWTSSTLSNISFHEFLLSNLDLKISMIKFEIMGSIKSGKFYFNILSGGKNLGYKWFYLGVSQNPTPFLISKNRIKCLKICYSWEREKFNIKIHFRKAIFSIKSFYMIYLKNFPLLLIMQNFRIKMTKNIFYLKVFI